jgi:HNH endonuclease
MAISKEWVGQQANRESVLRLYRSTTLLTLEKIAGQLGTTYHNVSYVIRQYMPEAEKKALAKLRYSASKSGRKNPMKGKTGTTHPRWIGECEDGYGYLTCIHTGKRRFVHHIVMMKALSLKAIPKGMEVHHIDEDPKNNELDNLALTTKKGHRSIHYLQKKDSLAVALKKSSIADALKFMTSP